METIEERVSGACSPTGKAPAFMANATSLFIETGSECKSEEDTAPCYQVGQCAVVLENQTLKLFRPRFESAT